MKLLGRIAGRGIGHKLSQLHQELDRRTDVIDRKLGEIAEKIEELAGHLPQVANSGLLLGERTDNISQSDYRQELVRTFPGKIFNRDKPCTNPAFVELLKQASGDEVADGACLHRKLFVRALSQVSRAICCRLGRSR
jgi:hypothetical protein